MNKEEIEKEEKTLRRRVELSHLRLGLDNYSSSSFWILEFCDRKTGVEIYLFPVISSVTVNRPLKSTEPFPSPFTSRINNIKHVYLKGML